MADEEISRLLTKFEVDEDSVRESARKTEEATSAQKQLMTQMRALEQEGFEASLDLKRERQTKHFENMEEAIRRHWATRLEITERGSEEEKRILERRNSDLEKLDAMRKQAVSQEQLQSSGRGDGGGGGTSGITQALGGAGWGSIMGIGSVAGISALLATSFAELRKSQTEARHIGERAGRDEDFEFGLAPEMQQLMRTHGLKQETAARIAGEFVPIAPGGMEGGKAIGNLTTQAVELGAGRGMDPQIIARMMTQFTILEGTALPALAGKITDLANAADKAGIPADQYIATLSTMVQQNRQYGTSIEQNQVLMNLFSRELQQGTISVQEIVQAQNAAAKAPMGLQAMAGMAALRAGGPMSEYLNEIGATDPFSAAMAIRTTLQGGFITPEGEAIMPSQQTAAQKDSVADRRKALEKGMFEMVMQFGQQVVPEGSAWQQKAAGLTMAGSMFGIGGNIANMDQLVQGMTGERGVSRGLLPSSGRGADTPEELMERGRVSLQAAIPELDKFKNAVGMVADVVNRNVSLMDAAMRGDHAAFDRIKRQIDEDDLKLPPGSASAGGARLLGGSGGDSGGFSPYARGPVFTKIVVEDKTDNKNHHFTASEENPTGTSSLITQGNK